MADFMRDDVSLGEIARGLESVFELLEKAHVEVDVGIRRAIERADRRARPSTRRKDLTVEGHQLGLLILLAHLFEEGFPNVLGIR